MKEVRGLDSTRKKFNMDELLVASGCFAQGGDDQEQMGKFSELLYQEFQKMSLQEFKGHIRYKLIIEKNQTNLWLSLVLRL